MREEKEVLVDQVGTLQAQVEAQNLVVRKLEEKEQILQNTLSTVEKELGCVFVDIVIGILSTSDYIPIFDGVIVRIYIHVHS